MQNIISCLLIHVLLKLMELILLALLFLVTFVGLVGVVASVVFCGTLCCARVIWADAPRDGLAGWFVPRSRQLRAVHWLRRKLAHQLTLPPASLPPGPVLYACRPHGVLATSACLTFLTGAADRRAHKPTLLAVHSAIFNVPVMREVALAFGCIDVSRDSIEAALCNGFSVAVLPGGVREMGAPLLPMPELPGVVKLAHAYNVPLVPVHFGGEQELCWVWKNEPLLIRWMRLQTYAWIGLYFPLVFCPRVWNMPTLHTRMGPAFENPHAMGSAADLGTALKRAEQALGMIGVDG